MGWDGMGWDGMGWDGMGWDGMGWEVAAKEFVSNSMKIDDLSVVHSVLSVCLHVRSEITRGRSRPILIS